MMDKRADGYTYVTYPIGYIIQPNGRVMRMDGVEIDANDLVSFEHRQIALERQALVAKRSEKAMS
jgi:hypothetical protein